MPKYVLVCVEGYGGGGRGAREGGIGQSSETRENLDCWEIRKDCKITSIW